MRNLFVTICLFFVSFISVFAQDSTKNTNPDWVVRPEQKSKVPTNYSSKKAPPTWTQHMQYGGNFALSYFNGAFIELSPMAGYRLNEKGTIAGLGLVMIYTSNTLTNYSSFDFGLRPFIEQRLFRFVSLHGELEFMNSKAGNFFDYTDPNVDPYQRKWEAYPQVGIVFYPSKIRGDYGGASYYISLMYNLSYPNAGYRSPYNLGNGLSLRIGYF